MFVIVTYFIAKVIGGPLIWQEMCIIDSEWIFCVNVIVVFLNASS